MFFLAVVVSILVMMFLSNNSESEHQYIFEKVYGFQLPDDSTVVKSKQSSFIENIFSRKYGGYYIKLSKSDHESLVYHIGKSKYWKLQPISEEPRERREKRFERLMEIDELGLIGGAHVKTGSRVVRLFYFSK